MVYPKRVFITEVGPSDGLQMEKKVLSTDQKTRLISGLVKAGVSAVQVASFVHPGKVPQMADAEPVIDALPPTRGCVQRLDPQSRGNETHLSYTDSVDRSIAFGK